ncbi:hypothetical protein EZS27_004701 [termite gut metagenome]|uniref:HTH cro/C1-type domain-containing protein n=1 Tax=termite gut metagenome TaxID=433724 RepID=A0A5J4SP63_9ZZZZ
MKTKKDISEYLKIVRQHKGYSMGKVAREGKIRSCQVADIEAGARNYTVDSLLGYLAGLGLEITFTNSPPGNDKS